MKSVQFPGCTGKRLFLTVSSLPDAAKWLLSLLMLLGRLELFTVLLLFTPDFWKKN